MPATEQRNGADVASVGGVRPSSSPKGSLSFTIFIHFILKFVKLLPLSLNRVTCSKFKGKKGFMVKHSQPGADVAFQNNLRSSYILFCSPGVCGIVPREGTG